MDTSIEKQIKEIEDEIFKTQKNKATEHHIGKLKAIEGAIDDARAMHKAAQTTGASLITHDEATKARMQLGKIAAETAYALRHENAANRQAGIDAATERAREKMAMDSAKASVATDMRENKLFALKHQDTSADELALERYPKFLASLKGLTPAPATPTLPTGVKVTKISG